MNKLSRLTIAFVVVLVVVVTAFDVWTLAFRGYETTISWVIYKASQGWPIIPYALGVLTGHLFFPNHAGGQKDNAARQQVP